MSKERIQNLEALLRRVQKNAAEPREERAFAAPLAASPAAATAPVAPAPVAAAPAAAAPIAPAPVAAARAAVATPAPAAKPRAASPEDPANWSMQDLALDEPRPAAAEPAAARSGEPRPEPLRFAGKSFEVPAARTKLADTPPVRGFGAMKPAQAPRFGKTQLGLEDQAAKVLQETLKTPAPKPSEPRTNEPVVARKPSPVENRAFHEAATAEVPRLDLPPVPPAEDPAPPRTFGWRDELPTHEAIAALPIVNVAGSTQEEGSEPSIDPLASEPPIAIEPSISEPPAAESPAPRVDEPDARRFAEPERMPPQVEAEPATRPAAQVAAVAPAPQASAPEKPAFSADAGDAPSKFAAPADEVPTKKKSSLLLVFALIAVLVGAGVFAYKRFFQTTGAPNKKTPAVLPTATPTTDTTTAATTTATAEAFPTASGDPAAPTASASAAPTAAIDDVPPVPSDPKQLPLTLGYLLVKGPEGKVFLNGQNAGDVNTWLKVSCAGTKFLRLGKAGGGWIDEGKSIALKCRESTVIPTP